MGGGGWGVDERRSTRRTHHTIHGIYDTQRLVFRGRFRVSAFPRVGVLACAYLAMRTNGSVTSRSMSVARACGISVRDDMTCVGTAAENEAGG